MRIEPWLALVAAVSCRPTAATDSCARAPAATTDAGICACDDSDGCTACPSGSVCDLTGACVSPSYFNEGDGTLEDEVTCLSWQSEPPADPCPQDDNAFLSAVGCTQSDAESYCAKLALGEWSSGWRLPTLAELWSLVDPGSTSGTPSAFPSAPADGFFWTGDETGDAFPTASSHWAVAPNPGLSGRELDEFPQLVRCVHGS